MRRTLPDHRMDMPVSLEIYQKLAGASIATGFEKEDWEIAEEAINEWLRRHNPDAIPLAGTRGYQWKGLFLPDGTVLRTIFGGKNHHCLVEGDRILYNGQAVSPSGFANAVGGIRRNAWRSTWVLLPSDKDWKLADTLRTRQRVPRQRQSARPLPPPAKPPSAACPPTHLAPAVDPAPDRLQARAAGVSGDPAIRLAAENKAPQPTSTTEKFNRQECTGLTLSPPPFKRGPERRARADDGISSLLLQKLLPLLYRLSGRQGRRPETTAWPGEKQGPR